jgi:hypothetical protein
MWSLLAIEVAKYFDTPFGFRVTNFFPYIYYLRHVAPFFSQIQVYTYTISSSRLDPGFYGVRVVHICVFF